MTQGIGYYGETEKNSPIFRELYIDPYFKRAGKRGTDLYIISFIENNKWIEELVTAVLDNFLIAIYNNHLVVKVSDVTISRSTLGDIMSSFKIENSKKYKSIWDYYNVLVSTSDLSISNNIFLLEIHSMILENMNSEFSMKILTEKFSFPEVTA